MENPLDSKADKEQELRRVIRVLVEESLDLTNPKDKYIPGTLKDDSEGYINKVTRLVENAMADPNSPIRKKAQEKINASFTN